MDVSRSIPGFSGLESVNSRAMRGLVILLGLSLAIVAPPLVFGETNQQQEQQQREEQQRQEQAREQQQRQEQERQAREEQQRQEQQREEGQRQEQAREQQRREEQERQAREEQQRQEQQREEQQRQEQAREHQQREDQERQAQAEQQHQEQQRREKQAREQQQRDELQREEQERHRAAPVIPVHSSTGASPSVNPQLPNATPAGSNADFRRKSCAKEPCVAPKPLQPEPVAKACKDRPCPVCAPGQSPGKDNSCVAVAQANAANAPPKANVPPQACLAGQVWNGVQCAPISGQQCLPGQAKVGSSCQADCTLATAGAQSYIERLRMARQDKDSACLKNPTGGDCRSAEATYQMRIAEYRAFLGGVATQCTLPDPISI